MGRLIDADAFMKAMYHRAFETDGDTMWQSGCWVRYRAVEQTVREQPTVDAITVIRCRDCKYVSRERSPESARKFGQLYDCGLGVLASPKADDFCSYGERRKE